MTNKPYNGWYNYETWVVKLWMDNDEGSDAYWRDQAEECVKVDGREGAVRSLEDLIKEQHEEAACEKMGSSTCGVFNDLMTAALSEVNWREIAQHLVDEAADALISEGVEIEA